MPNTVHLLNHFSNNIGHTALAWTPDPTSPQVHSLDTVKQRRIVSEWGQV